MRKIEPRFAYRSLVAGGVVLPLLVLISRLSGLLDWFYENTVGLGLIQIISAFLALSGGTLLLVAGAAVGESEIGLYRRRYVPWMSGALISMGILWVTAAALPNERYQFLWAELAAQLVGALFCALVWIPEDMSRRHRARIWIPGVGIGLSIVISGCILSLKEYLPPLVHGHYFNRAYILASGLAGILFLLSTVQCVLQFRKYQRSSDLVFAHLTLLLGMTNLTSERFHAWGPIWWSWHIFQMAAFCIVFIFVFRLIAANELALQHSRARFVLLAESVYEGLFVLDRDVITDSNRASQEMTGLSESELLGRSISSIFAGLSLEEVGPDPLEAKLVTASGGQIDVEVRSRVQGAGTARILTAHDISYRKEQETKIRSLASELERSNQELSNYAHLASHDLQEPLRMISSFLGLLARKNEAELDDQAKEYIAYALDGARRLKVLVDGILTHAKVSKLPMQKQTVNLNTILQEAVRDLGVSIAENHAQLNFAELPPVWGDPLQIRRLFENLIQNALRYRSQTPPQISVTAANADAFWRISVSDNGRGIPLEYQKKIFDLFARGPGGSQDGTGMGLAACKAIVERHGGQIGVRSRPGEGSSFSFLLPKVPTASLPRTTSPVDPPPAQNRLA